MLEAITGGVIWKKLLLIKNFAKNICELLPLVEHVGDYQSS